jgi:phosphoribosylglycinamide formyltransferase 1
VRRTLAEAQPERAKVAVLISGSGTNMAALLYAARAADCPFEIVLVASNKAEAAGLKLAEAEGLATFVLPHKGMERADHDRAMDAAIRQSGAQYVALAGYMRILTGEFVSRWEGRMLNIHPSLLPKYPGLHTHERALEAGDSHAGCTVHLVTAELDDGPVLGQTAVAVLPGDTADTLAARVLIAEHQLYARCLGRLVTREHSTEYRVEQVRTRAMAQPETEETLSPRHALFRGDQGQEIRLYRNQPPQRRQARPAGQDQRARRAIAADRKRSRALLPPCLFWRRLDFDPAGSAGCGLG